jgi:predicted oxidoreductase
MRRFESCRPSHAVGLSQVRSPTGNLRTAKPHKLLDPDAGPLIAARLNILTRKTLGGLQTDLDSRVLAADGQPVPGLYAAGEVAGLGGRRARLSKAHSWGCVFSGRAAEQAAAKTVG